MAEYERAMISTYLPLSDRRSCKSCTAYQPICKLVPGTTATGECRRSTPKLGKHGAARWPIVRAEDWCSRFEVEHINESGDRLSHIATASPVDHIVPGGLVNEQGRAQ